jgi:hypothetical protein
MRSDIMEAYSMGRRRCSETDLLQGLLKEVVMSLETHCTVLRGVNGICDADGWAGTEFLESAFFLSQASSREGVIQS